MKTHSLNRRKFLTASSAAFTAVCEQTSHAESAGSFIIDCQSHLFAPEMIALMEKRTTDPRVFMKDGVRMLQMGDWMRKIQR